MKRPDLHFISRSGDALIIVPPFAGAERPALGPHILQACARASGFEVSVLYASLLLAAEIGEENYTAISYYGKPELLGERVFASAAYGVPPLGRGTLDEADFCDDSEIYLPQITLLELRKIEARAACWSDLLAEAIARFGFKVVGCSTTFQQTAASIALLKRIKQLRPEIITVIGGANCQGEMAEGVLSLDAVDFVFEGESDLAFVKFLNEVRSGRVPPARIVRGEEVADLDLLPTPDFSEYYEQFALTLPTSEMALKGEIWLPYESSRGCWWGQKHHCTFCGLSDETMTFRAKSAGRVISDLKHLLEKHPTRKVAMADWIMPFRYHRELIPLLPDELPDLHLFYEQKANLTLVQVVNLKRAGVAVIQPGIESLSSSVLKRIKKGVTAPQNIALLRYARSVDLALNWNLIYGFPGDLRSEYGMMLELIPLLRHLQPPSPECPLVIDRFSPYFTNPAEYGISNVRPWETYAAVLPEGADAAKVAYHFQADYVSDSKEGCEIIGRISDEIANWRRFWSPVVPPPALALTMVSSDQFILFDTRGLRGTQEITFITRDQARLILAGSRLSQNGDVQWALNKKLVVEMDSRIVPLATAKAELIQEFENETR